MQTCFPRTPARRLRAALPPLLNVREFGQYWFCRTLKSVVHSSLTCASGPRYADVSAGLSSQEAGVFHAPSMFSAPPQGSASFLSGNGAQFYVGYFRSVAHAEALGRLVAAGIVLQSPRAPRSAWSSCDRERSAGRTCAAAAYPTCSATCSSMYNRAGFRGEVECTRPVTCAAAATLPGPHKCTCVIMHATPSAIQDLKTGIASCPELHFVDEPVACPLAPLGAGAPAQELSVSDSAERSSPESKPPQIEAPHVRVEATFACRTGHVSGELHFVHILDLSCLALDVFSFRHVLARAAGAVVTGDASLNEALVSGIPFWYSTEPHKRDVQIALTSAVQRAPPAMRALWQWLDAKTGDAAAVAWDALSLSCTEKVGEAAASAGSARVESTTSASCGETHALASAISACACEMPPACGGRVCHIHTTGAAWDHVARAASAWCTSLLQEAGDVGAWLCRTLSAIDAEEVSEW
ncbi:hypothetical protein EON66_05385 [archaeon]|nr:MAG: hypothetical protein EON66_05385 [archaeon]